MGRFVVSHIIKAPLKETFAFLANGENAPQWHPSVVSAKTVGATALGKGFLDVLYARIKGPLKTYRLVGRFEVVDHATRVTMEGSYSLAFPLSLLDGPVVERRVREHFQKGLERAAELLKQPVR